MVISVHGHIIKERKVDARIFRYMRKERFFGFTGILFIVIGFILFVIDRTVT